nr:MAG TPA: hypothetical protein [Caudoviricetes sp.]
MFPNNVIVKALYPLLLIVSYKFRLYLHLLSGFCSWIFLHIKRHSMSAYYLAYFI